MKNTRAAKKRFRVAEDLRAEYHFDCTKAKPNRFAPKARQGPLVVVLDEDIARIFKTPESVRVVLRALISAMPRRGKGATGRRTAKEQ
jgi:hypothetical protein